MWDMDCEGSSEGGRWLCFSLVFFFLRRRTHRQSPTPMAVSRISPPTAPPTAAPITTDLFVFFGGGETVEVVVVGGPVVVGGI